MLFHQYTSVYVLLFIILTKNETEILLIILYLIAFTPLIND